MTRRVWSMRGHLAILLHAHLPYVRHPEHERFLEESWFFEAVTEVYLPLLGRLRGLRSEGVRFRLTLSLSPTLGAMLEDDLLRGRWRRRHEQLIELARREGIRHRWQPVQQALAQRQAAAFDASLRLWDEIAGDLPAAFGELERSGHLELITCAATHAVLPLLADEPTAIAGQVATAVAEHQRRFGRSPGGFWLPECAWDHAVEPALAAAGIRWFAVETHALLDAGARYGVFAPVATPRGLAAFAREPTSARQVWSREIGYPGDPRYREFHHDLGHEAELEYVRPFLPGPIDRGFTGLKYHAVTGGEPKRLYDPGAAEAAVGEHARHFVASRAAQARGLAAVMPEPPVLLCPYDAELFGHWWHEGPDFLAAVIRAAAACPDLDLVTPSQHLARMHSIQRLAPVPSTWGQGGHLGVWLQPANEWIQRETHAAIRRFRETLATVGDARHEPARWRSLEQAARELLLAQASDWPFILHTGTGPTYAVQRVREHLAGLDELCRLAASETPDLGRVAALAARHPLFPTVDPALWR